MIRTRCSNYIQSGLQSVLRGSNQAWRPQSVKIYLHRLIILSSLSGPHISLKEITSSLSLSRSFKYNRDNGYLVGHVLPTVDNV